MVDLWSLALSIEQVEDGATKDFLLVKWESGDRKRFEDLSFCDSQNDGLWNGKPAQGHAKRFSPRKRNST
jgi:hypothetical protein